MYIYIYNIDCIILYIWYKTLIAQALRYGMGPQG